MKKLLFALMIILLPIMAMANVNLGIKAADEFIVMPLLTLDSAGVDKAPDSIQILTWLDGGTGLQFSTRNTTYPFSAIGIDTSKIFADTTYWFVDQIQDIDGSPTPQNYNLAIDVITWTSVIATHNRATVQVISDSLEVTIDDITVILGNTNNIGAILDTTFAIIDTLQRFTEPTTDTLQAIIDTLQLQDNWVAREASLYDPATDSVIVDASSAQVTGGLISLISDTAWLSSLEARDGVAGSFGDSAQTWGNVTVATNNDKTGYTLTVVEHGLISDSVWLHDTTGFTAGGSFGFAATHGAAASISDADMGAIADSVWTYDSATFAGAATAGILLARAYDSTLGIIDSIQNLATLTLMADSIWLSSLEARDGTAGSFGDSAQGWGATSAGGTDTANIKIMMAGNPEITSGYQVSYRGSVAQASGATATKFIVDGIDLSKANNFYDNMKLVWFFGALIGESQPITRWATTSDSIHTRAFSAAPADNDSFIIVPIVFSDLYAVSSDSTAANNAEAFFDGTGYAGTGNTIPTVTTTANLTTNNDKIGYTLTVADQDLIADAVLDTMEVGTRQINYRSLTVDSGTVLAATNAGVGLTVTGGAGSGDAMGLSATDGHGLNSTGGTNGTGMRLVGAGTGDGLAATGGTTGHGGDFTGGSGAATIGMRMQTSGTGANSYGLRVFSGTGIGTYITGGGVSGGADGMRIEAGFNGNGLFIQGGSTAGHATHFRGRAGVGMQLEGGHNAGATGAGLQIWGGAGDGSTGDGVSIIGEYDDGAVDGLGAGTGDGVDIHTNSTAAGDYAVELTTQSTALEILAPIYLGAAADTLLDRDTTDANNANSVGLAIGKGYRDNLAILDSVNAYDNADGQWDKLGDTLSTITADVKELKRAEIHITGAVTGGSPGVTGIGSTTQLAGFADDYWNNQVVVFVTGNAVGQSTRITDFTDATDSITFDAISVAPAAGDSFVIVAQYDAGGGAASISQADMAEIADSVWHADLELHDGTAGSFGDSAQGWGATSAGGTDTLNIKTMMERNFTSASGGDGWANMLADSTWLLDTTGNKIATGFGNILGKVNDSLEAQDGWVAREASLYDPATDSVIVDGSSLAATADAITATTLASTAALEISDTTWDEVLTGGTHNVTNSAGKRLRELSAAQVIHSGTSDNVPANTASTISLQTGGGDPTVSSVDNFYNDNRIVITGGTGVGQNRIIPDYDGSNQSATIARDWDITPDATSEYEIVPAIVHAQTQGGSYEDGAVWISSNGSTTALVGVDGTIDNPIDDGSIANARTVADAKNLQVFHLLPGASVTLDQAYDDWEFVGKGYTLALGGQSIAGSHINNGFITGVGTGASRAVFRQCVIGNIDVDQFAMLECGLLGTIKMTDNANYTMDGCFASQPGDVITLSFSTTASTNLIVQHWSGSIMIDSMGEAGTDSVTIAGIGNVTFTASNVAGVAIVQGISNITDNSVTLTSLAETIAVIKGDSALYMNTKSMGGVANTASPVNVDEAFNDNGVGSDMDLNSLHIIATGTNDTGVVIRGDGSGGGSFVAGGATGIGLAIEGGATSGGGIDVSTTNGHGMQLTGTGTNNGIIVTGGVTAVRFIGTGTGNGLQASGGATGSGFRIDGGATSGDALRILTSGSGDFISSGARDELATTISDSIWLSLLEARDGVAGSFGDSAQTWGAAGGGGGLDTLQTVFVDRLTTRIADSIWLSLLEARDGTAGSFGDSAQGWGASGGGGGNDTLLTAFVDRLLTRIADSIWLALLEARDGTAGSFGDSSQTWGTQVDLTSIPGADVSMTYRAIDTATSTAIQGVSVSAYNKSDVRVAFGTTNGSGQVVFGFKLDDTVYFNSTNPIDFVWTQRDTVFGVTNGLIDTTEGFQFSGDAPAVGKTAAVTVFVTNNDRTPAINIAVSAYLSRSKVVDSAGFPVYNQTQTLFTDSDGKVTFTCIWSSYMIPATQWYFTTSVPGTIKKKITITRDAAITLDLR